MGEKTYRSTRSSAHAVEQKGYIASTSHLAVFHRFARYRQVRVTARWVMSRPKTHTHTYTTRLEIRVQDFFSIFFIEPTIHVTHTALWRIAWNDAVALCERLMESLNKPPTRRQLGLRLLKNGAKFLGNRDSSTSLRVKYVASVRDFLFDLGDISSHYLICFEEE